MFLLFGLGIWFWSLVILEFCLLTWFVEEDWPAPSIASLIIFILCLWWLADIPIWSWIHDNPFSLFKYFVYYLVIGIVWSICKYYFALKKVREIVKEKRIYYDKMEDKPKTFKEHLHQQRTYDDNSHKFEDTATNLIFWASFWPPSMVWTILNDPIKKLFRFLIFDVFVGIYRKMYKKMVGDLVES